MVSKAGSILTLIGGILTLVFAIVILFVGLVVLGLDSVSDKIGRGVPLDFLTLILFSVFVFLLIGGILKIYASRLMLNKKTALKGGIIAIIFGVIISDILSLIGGIIAIVQGNK